MTTGPRQAPIGIAVVAAAVLMAACTSPDASPTSRSGDGREVGPTRVAARASSVAEAADLRFAVVGDFGTGAESQRTVARRMCGWRASHPFDLALTTGDNVYPDGRRRYFRRAFFDPFACMLEGGVEFRAVLGNHDVMTDDGIHQLDEPRFGMPKRNYVFRRGPVRFVMMNSNRVRLGWLERALQPQPGDLYTVVAMHHPVFSPGTHGSTPGMRPDLPRAFRRAGVDLVVAGHDHLYSVTRVLRGIRYVVTGGGGAPGYPCHEAWFVDVCRSRLHFLYVRADHEAMRVRAVPAVGRVLDRFVIAPGG